MKPGLMAALGPRGRLDRGFHAAQSRAHLEMPGPRPAFARDAMEADSTPSPFTSRAARAAYPSSVLMNARRRASPASAASQCCVPRRAGSRTRWCWRRRAAPAWTRSGGSAAAQAVAALAWGRSIARWTASSAPASLRGGSEAAGLRPVGIDSIAGPSEVVVLADGANDPRHVALDLLAQAEHDESAQSILVTDDAGFADATAAAVEDELRDLPRRAIAGESWRRHGAVIVVRDWAEGAALTDRLAPEHLQVMVADPAALFARVRHAGAAFLGRWCPEALGDYAAGPNHVLPTGRTARFASGLSVFDMLKRTTWVEASEAGLAAIGPAAVALAEAEGLGAHAASVAARLPRRP
jgi:histidinol dehydrogenase